MTHPVCEKILRWVSEGHSRATRCKAHSYGAVETYVLAVKPLKRTVSPSAPTDKNQHKGEGRGEGEGEAKLCENKRTLKTIQLTLKIKSMMLKVCQEERQNAFAPLHSAVRRNLLGISHDDKSDSQVLCTGHFIIIADLKVILSSWLIPRDFIIIANLETKRTKSRQGRKMSLDQRWWKISRDQPLW